MYLQDFLKEKIMYNLISTDCWIINRKHGDSGQAKWGQTMTENNECIEKCTEGLDLKFTELKGEYLLQMRLCPSDHPIQVAYTLKLYSYISPYIHI